MDDRELAERLTNIETKINMLLENAGYEYNDEEGYHKPKTKEGK
jgi:hypothetical protein